jgi:hypothetical protein
MFCLENRKSCVNLKVLLAMTPPIILHADDGISWWRDPLQLQQSIESPDIEAGIYTAWDALGQVLRVLPMAPAVRSTFPCLASASVTCGKLVETGKFRPEDLRSAIFQHLFETQPSIPPSDMDLQATVALLCEVQPCDDYP